MVHNTYTCKKGGGTKLGFAKLRRGKEVARRVCGYVERLITTVSQMFAEIGPGAKFRRDYEQLMHWRMQTSAGRNFQCMLLTFGSKPLV